MLLVPLLAFWRRSTERLTSALTAQCSGKEKKRFIRGEVLEYGENYQTHGDCTFNLRFAETHQTVTAVEARMKMHLFTRR